MDTAPAAKSDARERAPAGERPEIGVPSIVARTERDPKPVPSIPLPGEEALLAGGRGQDESAVPLEPTVSAVPIDPTAPTGSALIEPAPPVAPAIPSELATRVVPVHLVAVPSEGAGWDGGHEQKGGTGNRAEAPPTPAGGTSTIGGGLPVEDGEEAFTPAVQAKLKSYVYLLVDPRTGRPIHAGLGRGDRCFDHVRAARDKSGRPVDGARPLRGDRPVDGATVDPPEYPELDRIRQVEAAGRPVRIEILRYGLDRDQALLVEAVAHDLLGLPGTPLGGSQRRPVGDVRLLLTKRAKFKPSHQVVLLRAGPAGTDTSYGRVRHAWRIGRRWVDVDAPRSPRWAVVVVGELVDSVYRLDRWEPSRLPAGAPARGKSERAADRYSFVGTRDPELEHRYIGKSVAPYYSQGAQSPVAYVWSGPHWVNTAH